MSNQPEHENQQPEMVSTEEVREYLLTELEASKQAIAELNDEQLEQIAGGVLPHPAKQVAAVAGLTVATGGVLTAMGYGIYRLAKANHKHEPQPSSPVNPNAPRDPRPWQVGGEQDPTRHP